MSEMPKNESESTFTLIPSSEILSVELKEVLQELHLRYQHEFNLRQAEISVERNEDGTGGVLSIWFEPMHKPHFITRYTLPASPDDSQSNDYEQQLLASYRKQLEDFKRANRQ